jgi:arylsulfatase A-like enzyme
VHHSAANRYNQLNIPLSGAHAAGWDFINSNETNIAQMLGASGYKTSVFGKWHNGRTAGCGALLQRCVQMLSL